MLNNIKITNWHFESTTRCTLACSKCPRTIHNDLLKILDLDVKKLESFFTDSVIEPVQTFLFCGNHGDPIYHRDFHNFLRFFKERSTAHIKIITNGSHRSKDWWTKTVSLLSKTDTIEFSIDGLEDTNHLYRKNSNWQNIMDAFDICVGNVDTSWRFIVFKYNQHQIEQARELANKKGIENFIVIKSTRYSGDDDPLKPDDNWVSDMFKKRKEWSKIKTKKKIDPACIHGIGHFISAEGIYTPCCHMSSLPLNQKNIFYKDTKNFDIEENTLQEIQHNYLLNQFQQNWNNWDSAHKTCQRVCAIDNNQEASENWRYLNNDYDSRRITK